MRPLLTRIAGSFIQLEVLLDSESVCVALASDQVEQILLDLVVRGSDAMPLGGKLVVATRRWRPSGHGRKGVGASPDGRWATLRVVDSGPTHDEDDEGRGWIGCGPVGNGIDQTWGPELAKVASIVKAAGGHLLVEEGNPGGCEVVVCLPAKENASNPSRVSANTPAILVVDGDAWLQTTTAHVLRRAGYGVLQADHANGALELLRGVTGSCIRLMLVDIDLASADARALTLAAQRTEPDLHVVFVGRARAGSSEDLLTKPFTAVELLQAVSHRLGPASRG